MVDEKQLTIRKATLSDVSQIKELFFKCFGEMAERRGALKSLDNYIVAEDNSKIVAISGIVDKSDSLYDGYEVAWTCCDEEYRHKGIVTNILKQCIEKLPDDGVPVYCDCWRVNFNEKTNLDSTMKNLGMKLFYINIAVYNKDYISVCRTCPYRNDSERCHCVMDLYRKERK